MTGLVKDTSAPAQRQDPRRMSRERFAQIFRVMNGTGTVGDMNAVNHEDMEGLFPAVDYGTFEQINQAAVQLFEGES